MARKKALLVLTQAYPPDPMSVGQHLAGVAEEMVRRGYPVAVACADRGYDDPTLRYRSREVLRGVSVRRLPFSSFGKRSLPRRLAAATSFLAQCAAAGLTRGDLGAIVASTVPPLTGSAALLARYARGVPLVYWVMDMNPEQLLALGKLSGQSMLARGLDRLNRALLRASAAVVAVDRYMAERLSRKADLAGKLEIIPPWPHEEHLWPVSHAENPFRRGHGLEGKLVVMYSGNHSPSNPLRTVLLAAREMRGDSDVVFLFVGGGQGKREVEAFIDEHRLPNVRSLPYEPLERLRYSLSAADVHLVSLGDPFVGIIHPCKVYGAMAVARPVLFLGPRPSHIADLLDAHGMGWRVAHGDVAGAVRTLREIRAMPAEALAAMGERGRAALAGGLSQKALCGRFCDRLEAVMAAGRQRDQATPFRR